MPPSPYISFKNVLALRRMAARYPEKWRAVGQDITDEAKHPIGRMYDPDMVKLVVASHNILLAIINKLVQVLLKLRDRRVMDLEDESENK